MSDEGTRRTVLPSADAEGAGNFAAEPATDPTAGPTPENLHTAMEQGDPTYATTPSPAGEEGNRTGGEPAEEVAERRAGGRSEVEELQRRIDQSSIDQRADI